MDPSDFATDAYGVVRQNPEGLWWFDPAPTPRDIQLDPETMLALSRADSALGRLDGLARLLRNPDLIAIPYAAREAVASSRIEGTQATLSEVFESDVGRSHVFEHDVRLIRAYSAALAAGLEAVETAPFTLDTLRTVHRQLVGSAPHAGTWRDKMVWLGSPTQRPETAVFVPAAAHRLQELMEEWAEWHTNPPRLPLLIRAAILHYQFLTIHPFEDGNGRVGRMLIQMLLQEDRALPAPLLYVSAYFANRRREYYERLQAVRQRGELQQWLQFFLTAVEVQAMDGVSRAGGLLNLRERYREDLAGSRGRASEAMEMLFTHPVVTAALVSKRLEISHQGANNLLRVLEERRIVFRGGGTHGRGITQYWYAPRILGLIDDESTSEDESILVDVDYRI